MSMGSGAVDGTNGAGSETPGIIVFGADWCRDCRRAKRLFDEQYIEYRWVDLVADPDAAEVARDISGRSNIPVIVYPDGSFQVEPSNGAIRRKLADLGRTEWHV